jgi:hypothetical protein
VAPATPTPAPTPVPTVSTVSFKTHVVPLLKMKCSACHSTGGPGADKVHMFDSAGNARYSEIEDEIKDMVEETEAGRMPKGLPRLSSGELSTLRAWRDRGAPNN